MLEGGHLVQKAVLIGMGFSESAINDAIARNSPSKTTNYGDWVKYNYIVILLKLMETTNSTKAQFDAVMKERYNNANEAYAAVVPKSTRRSTFAFTGEAQVKEVFLSLWRGTYRGILQGFVNKYKIKQGV